MNSKPLTIEGSPCINCLVKVICQQWCYKLEYFFKNHVTFESVTNKDGTMIILRTKTK